MALPDQPCDVICPAALRVWTSTGDGIGRSLWTGASHRAYMQSLSPDGQHVTFTDNYGKLYVAYRGGYPVVLPTSGESIYHPRWSSDGRQIVFDEGHDIAVINADGTGYRKIITWKGVQLAPDFSPSGTEIVFSSTSDSRGKATAGGDQLFIATVPPPGSNRFTSRQVTFSTMGVNVSTDAMWSPDGQRLVFTTRPGSTNGRDSIYTVRTDGTDVRPVTSNPPYPANVFDREPSWSPDGTTVIFRSTRSDYDGDGFWDYNSIWRANADGSGLQEIVHLYPYAASPNLSPDAVTPTYRRASSTIGLDDYLAAKFRPMLFFDDGEHWRPLNVDLFARERDSAGIPYHEICAPAGSGGFACEPFQSLDMLAAPNYGSSNAELNIRGVGTQEDTYRSPYAECVGSTLYDCDTGNRSAMYYHTVKNGAYTYLDYWWFYRYNDVPDVQAQYTHEGDWEGMVIVPSTTNPETFDFASFAQHEGAPYSYLRSNLRCDGGGEGSCGSDTSPSGVRVNGYPAQGTHATYAAPCSILFGYCTQTNNAIPETSHDGDAPWGNNHADPATSLLRFPPAADWYTTAAKPWVSWPGRWGVGAESSTGPQSPANQARFQQPWNFQCADDGCPPAPVGARSAAMNESSASCPGWNGPDVVLLICEEGRLREARAEGGLGRPGSFSADVGAGRHAASAPGLLQVVGKPLSSQDEVRIDAPVPAGALVSLRVLRGDEVDTLSFKPAAALPERTTVAPAGASDLRIVLPDGSSSTVPSLTRKPVAAVKRAAERASGAGRGRVSIRSRGSELTVRFAGPAEAVQLLRRRGGRPLAEVHPAPRARTVRIAKLREARFLAVVHRGGGRTVAALPRSGPGRATKRPSAVRGR